MRFITFAIPSARSIAVLCLGCVAVMTSGVVAAADSPDAFRNTYPRIASYMISSGANWGDTAHREASSKRHLLIVGMWRNYSTTDTRSGSRMGIPEVVADIRARANANGNSGIQILKYTVTNESPSDPNNTSKVDQFNKLSNEDGPGGDWWGRKTSGDRVSSWTGTWLTNLTRFVDRDSNGDTFSEWKVERDYNLFLADGTFDGLYIDNFFYRPRVNADWNGDGSNDSKDDPKVRSWFKTGYLDSVQRIRSLDSNLFIMGNVDGNPTTGEGMLGDPEYQGLIGSLFEYAIGKSFSRESISWDMMMDQYRTTIANSRFGVAVFHVEGPAQDYATMRYGLTSALMDNGYYDYGAAGSRGQDYWYDEFDADLGHAIDPPQTKAWKQGVFMRRFQKGMALVNPKGNGRQTVSIPDGYRRIQGSQDPVVNSGGSAKSITLNARDGIVLLATDVSTTVPNPPQFDSN